MGLGMHICAFAALSDTINIGSEIGMSPLFRPSSRLSNTSSNRYMPRSSYAAPLLPVRTARTITDKQPQRRLFACLVTDLDVNRLHIQTFGCGCMSAVPQRHIHGYSWGSPSHAPRAMARILRYHVSKIHCRRAPNQQSYFAPKQLSVRAFYRCATHEPVSYLSTIFAVSPSSSLSRLSVV